MAVVVSKEGVWDVIAGSTSNTPALELNNLKVGSFIKVTCLFGARTLQRDLSGGFDYTLTLDSDADIVALSPTTQSFQAQEGWQACHLMVIYEVLGTTDGSATVQVMFQKGVLDGLGSLMNFTLLAETL
jgi:hypothetical protein